MAEALVDSDFWPIEAGAVVTFFGKHGGDAGYERRQDCGEVWVEEEARKRAKKRRKGG